MSSGFMTPGCSRPSEVERHRSVSCSSIGDHLGLSPSRKAIASSSTRTTSSIGMTGRTSNTKEGSALRGGLGRKCPVRVNRVPRVNLAPRSSNARGPRIPTSVSGHLGRKSNGKKRNILSTDPARWLLGFENANDSHSWRLKKNPAARVSGGAR